MIRNHLLQSIEKTISQHDYFSITDFEIKTSEKSEVIIEYRFDKTYYLHVIIPNSTSTLKGDYGSTDVYRIRAVVSPGEMAIKEELIFNGKDEYLKGILQWMGWLKNELLSIPFIRNIEEQNMLIKEMISKIKLEDDSYLTTEQIADFKFKLNELHEKYEESLKNQIKDKVELEQKLAELEKEFTVLKDTLSSLKKSSWLKSFGTKVIKWVADPKNKIALKAGANVVKAFLPENTFLDDKTIE